MSILLVKELVIVREKIKKHKEIGIDSLLISAAVFSVLIVLGKVATSLFLYVAIAYVVFCMIGKTKEFGIYLSIFLIPNITVFNSLGLTYIVNLLLAIPILRIIFRKQIKIDAAMFFCWGLLLLIEFLHIAVLGNIGNIAAEISTFICIFIVMVVSTNVDYCLQRRMIGYSLAVGVLTSSIVYLIINPLYLINLISNIGMTARFTAFASDPNYFSLYICLSLAVLVSVKELKTIDYVFCVLLGGIGLLTRSKMCYILLAIIVVYFVFKNLFRVNSKTGIRVVVALGIITVVIFSLRDQIGILFDNVIARAGLSQGIFSAEQLTSGRSTIMQNYLTILKDNPMALLFGYGLQYHLYLGEATGAGAHNTWMDIILAWGIIGFIVYLFFMISWNKAFRKVNLVQRKSGNFLPAIVMCLSFLALSCLSSTMFGWIMMVAMYSFQNEQPELKRRIENNDKCNCTNIQ